MNCVKQDEEIPGPLVEDAVALATALNSELTKLAVEL
jgi:hypothetical protein